MAYFINQDPNDPTTRTTGGAANTLGNQSVASIARPASAPASTSGQAFNFQRLLNANTGNSAMQTAALQNSANSAANDANQAIQTGSQNLQAAVKAGQPAIFNSPQSAAPPTSTYIPPPNLPGVTPTNPAGSELQPAIDATKATLANANYTGPTDATGYFSDAAAKTQAAQQLASGLGTTSGRQAQLGGSLLDALLTRGAAPATSAADLGTNLTNALTSGQDLAQKGSADTATYRQELQNYLNGLTTGQSNEQNQAQAAAQQKQQLNSDVAQYNKWEHSAFPNAKGPAPLSYDQWAQLSDADKESLVKASGQGGPFGAYAALKKLGIKGIA